MRFLFWPGVALVVIGSVCSGCALVSSYKSGTGQSLIPVNSWIRRIWRRLRRRQDVSITAPPFGVSINVLPGSVSITSNPSSPATLEEKVDQLIKKSAQVDNAIKELENADQELARYIRAEAEGLAEDIEELRTESVQYTDNVSTKTLPLQFWGLVLVLIGSICLALA